MFVSDHYGMQVTALFWFRLAPIVIVCSLFALSGIPRAAAQDAQTISRTVTVTSDPPGAMIWKKEGTILTCTGIRTPGSVELKFHGASDVQKIRLRRFGYNGKNLDIRPGDDRVNAALGAPAPDSFLLPDNSGPDLRELNAGLKKEFEGTLFADPELFPCVPFELNFVRVLEDEETHELNLGVAVILDPSFGGPPARVASHTRNRDERRLKVAQAALEGGIADLLAPIHRMAAKFQNLKWITVVCTSLTTEAYLETRTGNVLRAVPTTGYERREIGAINWVSAEQGITEVNDRTVEKVLRFVMPAAQMPDTLDKKAISDAVIAVGKISLSEQSDGSSNAPGSPQ